MSFMESFLKRKNTPKVVEMTINRQTIVDQMSSWLYATSVIDDNKDITNIQFGELFGASTTEHVPMKIFYKEVKR